MRTKTGGNFDPAARFCYFLAGGIEMPWERGHDYFLVAVNELTGATFDRIVRLGEQGKHILIDSGVFNLSMQHAKAHDMPVNVALSLPPAELDGFDALFKKYVFVIQTLGNAVWGYIEIDQGKRADKLQTRARLEDLGLRPIPVYHPLSDEWAYFDELAAGYNRVCLGNFARLDRASRLRLLATVWERKQRYPDLWLHVLGLTPNEWLNAYPVESTDSSSWLAVLKWSGYIARSDLRSFGPLIDGYRHALGSDAFGATGSQKAAILSAYGAGLAVRNWRRHMETLRAAGYDHAPGLELP